MDNQPNVFPGTSLPEPRAPTNFFPFLHMWWIMVCFSFIPDIFQSPNGSLTFYWYTLSHFKTILFYYSKDFRCLNIFLISLNILFSLFDITNILSPVKNTFSSLRVIKIEVRLWQEWPHLIWNHSTEASCFRRLVLNRLLPEVINITGSYLKSKAGKCPVESEDKGYVLCSISVFR